MRYCCMYYSMRAKAVVLLILITLSMAVPVMAANADRYSYITVQDVQIRAQQRECCHPRKLQGG